MPLCRDSIAQLATGSPGCAKGRRGLRKPGADRAGGIGADASSSPTPAQEGLSRCIGEPGFEGSARRRDRSYDKCFLDGSRPASRLPALILHVQT